jgi:hypothetical protein
VFTVIVPGDLKQIVFYSHETQFYHREFAVCVIPTHIRVHTLHRMYGVRRKQKIRHL